MINLSNRCSALCFLLLVLTSCSSLDGAFVEKQGVNSSVPGLIKAFDRATSGVRGKSGNGREIVSRYQKPGSTAPDNAINEKTRAYSRLLMLGYRRPYTIQLQYVVEERQSSGSYEIKHYDDGMARQTLKKVLDYLAHRPDREDFIDGFKAF